MARSITIIERPAWDAMLGELLPEVSCELRSQLESWQDGDVCDTIGVRCDSLGRLDSESSPCPGSCVKKCREVFCNEPAVGTLGRSGLPADLRCEDHLRS